MKHGVAALMLLGLWLAAWPCTAVAQTAVAEPALDCVVCHVKTLITAVRTYGPALSKQSLGGLDDVLGAFIGNGTSNMPGFKYSLAPGEIGAIVAYLKTLPAPAPR
jgi:mono/diheme cytochrome c family protein